MKTIEQLQSELRAFAADMNSELEQLKEQRADSTLTADFPKLSASASRYPIERHPLESQDEHTQKCYITLLLTVARFEPEMLSESLLFAHRVAFGMYYLAGGEDLKDEFLSSQTLTFEQLDEVTNLFRKSELRLMLLEECLLMAGAFDKGRKAAFEYIAQLAVMLNVDKEELTMLSNMAAVILTQDISQYRCQIRNTYSIFDCYINTFKNKDTLSVFYCKVNCQKLRDAYAKANGRDEWYHTYHFTKLQMRLCGNEIQHYLFLKDVNKGTKDDIFVDSYKMTDKKCTFLLSPEIFDTWKDTYNYRGTWTEETANLNLDICISGWISVTRGLPISYLEKALKDKPVGVLAHPLFCNENTIKDYFIANGGIINEP